MIILRWATLPNSGAVTCRVYRSIVGFQAPLAAGLSGLTLQLRLNGTPLQNFMFGAGSPVDLINQTIVGGKAFLSDDGVTFLVRSDIREAPGSLEIVGGTSLALLTQTPRMITERSEDQLIGSVPVPTDPNELSELTDQDGVLLDYYALTTVDGQGQESAKSNYRKPILSTGPICVIEGTIIDLQGVRIPDAEVIATLQVPPQSSVGSTVSKEPIRCQSGPDGRFSLPILQGAMIRLEIPMLGYTNTFVVPAKSYVFINDIVTDDQYKLQDQ